MSDFQDWCQQWAEEVYRVLKPGGHLLAFSGTRTYHRMVCGIEDAGFEVRDQISWLYGSGFPKNLDVGKAIDSTLVRDDPATEAAKQWQGWGTAIKPSFEPICAARKPLIGTVAENILTHGTGAINIDGCRVETAPGDYASGGTNDLTGTGWGHKDATRTEQHPLGRWPANVIHDGSDEILEAFAAYGGGGKPRVTKANEGRKDEEQYRIKPTEGTIRDHGDSGTAARFFKTCEFTEEEQARRFFYCAKASKSERNGSKHPTVKPVALMRYLCRLVTPKHGYVLDPFAGSGTTGQAAVEEGFNVILIEREAEYCRDIRNRLALFIDYDTSR